MNAENHLFTFCAFNVTFDICYQLLTTYCEKWIFSEEIEANKGYFRIRCMVQSTFMEGFLDVLKNWQILCFSNPANVDFYDFSMYRSMKKPIRNTAQCSRLTNLFLSFKPWQRKIVNWSLKPKDFVSNILPNIMVIDSNRMSELFRLRNYICGYAKVGLWLPLKEIKHPVDVILGFPKKDVYMFFLEDSSSITQELVHMFENLQSGYCLSTTNGYNEVVINPPYVWVFVNVYKPEHDSYLKEHFNLLGINEFENLFEK